MSKKISLWIVIILLLVAFGGGFVFAINAPQNASRILVGGDANANQSTTSGSILHTNAPLPTYLSKDVDFRLFWETWNLVKSKYYDKDVSDTKLFYGALQGMVAAVGDPYSVFMTPQDADDFAEELKGEFQGIGAEIGIKNNQLTIIAPLPDLPADKAGLRAKDWVLKIDGTDTANMAVDKAVSLIRGKKGTTVKLMIYRDGFSEPKEFSIVRDVILVKSVSVEIKKDSIAYIKIRQFNDDTVPLFDKAVTQIIKNKNIRGIIVDVRNNPGGYLQSAIDLAGEWVDGQLVVSEKLRSGETIEHRSDQRARIGDYKTVILVNGGSASASEIVAGALQDWGKATIVGTKTFGKGSVQDLTMLSDGSSIKLTIAKWFTPKGRSIQDQGIDPDITVELKDEDYNRDNDPQLDKAIELLSK